MNQFPCPLCYKKTDKTNIFFTCSHYTCFDCLKKTHYYSKSKVSILSDKINLYIESFRKRKVKNV